MRRKITAACMACLLSIAILAGCQNAPASAAKKEAPEKVSETQSGETEKTGLNRRQFCVIIKKKISLLIKSQVENEKVFFE